MSSPNHHPDALVQQARQLHRPTTSGLVAFLTARLDEDEETAREATAQTSEYWQPYFKQVIAPGSRYETEAAEANSSEAASHIARHDPARILREITAKRAVLDRHQPGEHWDGTPICRWCSPGEARLSWPCNDVRDLAAIYSDHPDYRQEWKP